MSQESSSKRPRMTRKRQWLTAIGLLVAVIFVVGVGSRLLFAPWSIGYFGRDTLTGGWVGSLNARQGAEYGLHLDLEYRDRFGSRGTSSGTRFNNLKGQATLCTPTGERFEYEVLGYASRSGEVEDLWLEYGDPSLSALNLRLSGDWQSPELTLSSDANPFLPDGSFVPTRSLSSDDPDDSFAPFALTKSGPQALEAICQRIRR